MKRSWWADRSLGIVLAALFLISWAFQAWSGWEEFQSEQAALGEPAHVFGESGYIWPFIQATTENWQSEFLQLLAFVVLTSFLIFRGSPESRDGQDEVMDSLRRIELRLEQVEGASSAGNDHPHPATGAATRPK